MRNRGFLSIINRFFFHDLKIEKLKFKILEDVTEIMEGKNDFRRCD